MIKALFYCFSFLFILSLSGQNKATSDFQISEEQNIYNDSLLSIWNDDTKLDSLRQDAYYNYIWDLNTFNKDSSIILANDLLNWAIKRDYKLGISDAYTLLGNIQQGISNYEKAIYYHNLSLNVDTEFENYEGQAISYGRLGEAYEYLGDYPKAINYYQSELKVSEDYKLGIWYEFAINNVARMYSTIGRPEEAMKYYQRKLNLIRNKEIDGLYEEDGSYLNSLESNALIAIGGLYISMGNYIAALENYLKALKICEDNGMEYQSSSALIAIADLYVKQDDHKSALKINKMVLKIEESSGFVEMGFLKPLASIKIEIAKNLSNLGELDRSIEYLEQSINIIEKSEDRQFFALTVLILGEVLIKAGETNKALEKCQEALKVSKEISAKSVEAIAYWNLGKIYGELNQNDKAEIAFNSSLFLLKQINDKQQLAKTYLDYGLFKLKLNKNHKAIDNCQLGLSMANQIKDTELQLEFCDCLYSAFKENLNSKKALEFHEKMLVLNDSLKTGETAKKLQRMEFTKQVLTDSLAQVEKGLIIEMEHKNEVRKKDKNRNLAIGAGIFFLVLSGGFFSRWRYVTKSKAIIEKEKDRSENLLLNILPAEIAEELKEKGKANARDFDLVSILFSDFKGFTQVSEKLTAQELIGVINTCFKAFDNICDKYGIEKIKTIGDAYMAAGGLPVPSDNSVRNTVMAALEMQEFIVALKAEKERANEIYFEMRLGINTGPVVAGIVGVKKFQYDIWGDTVNIASRMESSGEVGKVNISQQTYKIIKDDPQFVFESRGKIQAKGKGEVEMYFVRIK